MFSPLGLYPLSSFLFVFSFRYSGRLILLVNPIELKVLEDLILLRVPLEKLPPELIDCLSRPLNQNIASRVAPSKKRDFYVSMLKQIDRESVALQREIHLPTISATTETQIQTARPIKLVNPILNPAALPINMFGFGAAVHLPATPQQELLWYHNPKVLASCQLMYRSLLGYYCLKSKELKIRRSAGV